jgi:hypothetical protein
MRTPLDDEMLLEKLSQSASDLLEDMGSRATPLALCFNKQGKMTDLAKEWNETLKQFLERVNKWCVENQPHSLFVVFWQRDAMILFHCGMGHGDSVIYRIISKKEFIEPPLDIQNELVIRCFRDFLDHCAINGFEFEGGIN